MSAWTCTVLLLSLGGLLLLQIIFMAVKARRLVSLVELLMIANAVGLIAWRVYSFLLGQRSGLEPASAIAAGVVALVYLATVRMLAQRKVGLLAWAAMTLAGFFSFTFFAIQENEGALLPGFVSGAQSISTEELEEQRRQNSEYLNFVTLSGVKGAYYEDVLYGHSILLECDILNTGPTDIGTLTLSGTLLSENGAVLSQEEFYPVSKNAPLRAGKKVHVMDRFSETPEGWNPTNIDVRITELRLASNLMISAASFPVKKDEMKDK